MRVDIYAELARRRRRQRQLQKLAWWVALLAFTAVLVFLSYKVSRA